MTSLEAYKKFELKIDKLSTKDNVDISAGEFVIIFNEQQTKWFSNAFKNKSNRDSDKVQNLIIHDLELYSREVHLNHTDFSLPKDYFDYISSYSLAVKGTCKDRVIYNEEVKPQNKNILYKDEYNTPSFDFQEGFITLAGNLLQVYTSNFDIEKTFLTYYRYPKDIDIEGYIKIDGSSSKDIHPELSDYYTDQVIDWCAKEVAGRYQDSEGFQFSSERIRE